MIRKLEPDDAMAGVLPSLLVAIHEAAVDEPLDLILIPRSRGAPEHGQQIAISRTEVARSRLGQLHARYGVPLI